MSKLAHEEVPREQAVELVLSPSQQAASSVRITYAHEGEDVSYVVLRYGNGPPGRVQHTASLRPGAYDVNVELLYRDGHVEQVTRDLAVPTEGTARLALQGQR